MYLPRFGSEVTPQQEPWYDLDAFDRLVDEYGPGGHDLCLCKRVVEKVTDYGHGIPQKEIMVCTDQIVGFVEVQAMSQISVDGGKGAIVRANDLLVNILPRNGFDNNKLTKDSRLLFQGVYYQMALIDQPSNIHRGHLIFYQYRLSNAHKLAMEGPQLKPQMVPATVFFGGA